MSKKIELTSQLEALLEKAELERVIEEFDDLEEVFLDIQNGDVPCDEVCGYWVGFAHAMRKRLKDIRRQIKNSGYYDKEDEKQEGAKDAGGEAAVQ